MAKGKGRKAASSGKDEPQVKKDIPKEESTTQEKAPEPSKPAAEAPVEDAAHAAEATQADAPSTAGEDASEAPASVTEAKKGTQGEPAGVLDAAETTALGTETPIPVRAATEPVRETAQAVDYLQQLSPEEREKDLRNQVTSLNAKLVTSFNRVSDLEDELSVAHNRILAHTTHIAELHKEREQHLFALNTGLLVEKSHVTAEMQRMMERVLDETAQRGKAESDKTRIEAELEELSASLFNEANKMVAVERLERARAEEKSMQLQESLRDTERVLAEQQEMLRSLQQKVEQGQVGEMRADDAPAPRPEPAAPVLDRTLFVNIQPYQEFLAFVEHLRSLQHQLEPYVRLHQRGIDWTLDPSISQPTGLGGIGGVMSPSLTGQAAPVRHKDYPHLPASAEQFVQVSSQSSLPFIRRAQEEDTDPCLRLGHAPGLNWLSRRHASTSVLDGSLIIEPIFAGGVVHDEAKVRVEYGHIPPVPCTLCGTALVNLTSLVAPPVSESSGQKESTSRRSLPSIFQSLRRSVSQSDRLSADLHEDTTEVFSRDPVNTARLPIPTHYFRVSDSSNKYLVCSQYCLQRLRAVCGFWTFIRTLERAIVLEGKASPDLVGGTHLAAGSSALGPLGEGVQGASEAHDAQREQEKRAEPEAAREDDKAADAAPAAADAAENAGETSVDASEASAFAGTEVWGDAKDTAPESTDEPQAPAAAEEEPAAPVSPTTPPAPPPLPSRQASVPRPPTRVRTVRHSFHPNADKASLSWEESLWSEIMRLKEAMWKSRAGIDLDA
ncbi:hypothetical protein MOBT1_000460 [Malassezia obtusa]|uniref:GDP/GTP exchange factor Sec2 N-terminal domain-containing protein n=1 Tax=Malassezia obtusa TaxID=76774 RepID=A0AAF0DZB9_9BASI|nr:hypothetical protein MOBT1_000460 [Malassezia obtusa]